MDAKGCGAWYRHQRDSCNLKESHLEPTENTPLGRVLTIMTIATIIIGAIFWIANVSATASQANSLSQQNANEIQKKADREDLKEIKSDIKDIRDFLMNKRNGGR